MIPLAVPGLAPGLASAAPRPAVLGWSGSGLGNQPHGAAVSEDPTGPCSAKNPERAAGRARGDDGGVLWTGIPSSQEPRGRLAPTPEPLGKACPRMAQDRSGNTQLFFKKRSLGTAVSLLLPFFFLCFFFFFPFLAFYTAKGALA